MSISGQELEEDEARNGWIRLRIMAGVCAEDVEHRDEWRSQIKEAAPPPQVVGWTAKEKNTNKNETNEF